MTEDQVPFGSYYKFVLAMLFDKVFTRDQLIKLKEKIEIELAVMDKDKRA